MTSGGSEPSGEVASRRVAIGEAIIGAGVLALAAVMRWQTLAIPVSPIYAQVGPTVVPIITALALGMLGILLLIAAWQGGWQPEEEKASTPDRVALAWVAAARIKASTGS